MPVPSKSKQCPGAGPICMHCQNARKLAEQDPNFDLHDHLIECRKKAALYNARRWPDAR